jgi:hypothetical protein
LQKNARSRQSGDLTPDFVLCVPVTNVFDGVMVPHARELERSVDGLEIVGINRERNHEHIVVLVEQVVPLARSHGFQPATEQTAQRGPADLAPARDEVVIANDPVLRRVQKQIVGQKCSQTVREHHVGFDSFDLFS